MKDFDNRITADDIRLTKTIVEKYAGILQHPPQPLEFGSVNKVFAVELVSGQKLILKMTQEAGKRTEYDKEKWCATQARKQGVLTPEILLIDEYQDVLFMIQQFVEGRLGSDDSEDKLGVWSAFGSQLAKIHKIPTVGFGLKILDAEQHLFDERWEDFVNHNIHSLTAKDPLLLRGFITAKESKLMKRCFEGLKEANLPMGLCHGDIALRNGIVDADNNVHLLDWGCAVSDLVPYADFAQILRQEKPSWVEFQGFLAGYGMTLADWQEMDSAVTDVALLRATDLVRWALDHAHESLTRYTDRLRWALGLKFGDIEWFD